MFDLELMRQLSSVAGLSEAEIDQLRQNREEDAGGGSSFEGTGTPAHDIPVLSDEEVAALISPDARNLVVSFEVGSRALYERKYIEPEWPKGASGVTIGIGYDVGYHSKDEVKAHWSGLIAEADIDRLLRAVGVKGANAGAIISDFRGIRVPWDAAIAAYERSTMPKYGRWVLNAFPNAAELKGHAFGALFSLVFNRGAKMDGDRRREMRNIREACKAKTFDGVPQEFLDMRKLWAGQGLTGLIKRREAEAVLFGRGLDAMRVVAVASAATAGLQVESVQDESRFDGDGLYYEEDDDGPLAKEAVNNWEGVRWAESDDDAHDYQHIADRSLAGKAFEFDARALELLINANHFEPIRDTGRIVFGLRGAELVTSLASPGSMMQQLDRPSLTLRDCRPNHKDFRCVLGVYDLTTGRLSGFASSTVPNRKAVASYATNQVSGNMTPTGCYRFTVGWHLLSKPERRIPGCLVEAGRQKCVHRSPKNKYYDLLDSWENHKLHGNNLHPAKSESSAAFSSWGCLVVSGNYACTGARENGTHTGEWAQFRKALGLTKPGSGDHGLLFDVVMLTGLEGAIASDLIKRGTSAADPVAQEKLGRLRQGSKGDQVKALQRVLGLPETGVFGHEVAKAWADRQAKDFAGKSQGTYGPVSDAHYKWGVFAAPSAPGPVVVATIAGTQGTVAAVRRLETLAGSPAPDAASQSLKSLYYEIGLHTSAIQRNPSANTSTLESLNSGQLQSLQLEFGWADLQAKGSDLVRAIEQQLQDKLCSNNAAAMVNRDELGAKVEDAKQKSQGSLKSFIARLIATLIPGGAFFPDKLNEMIADAIIAVVVKPLADGAGQVFSNQVDFTAQWLCGRWCDRLGVPDQVAAAPAAAPVLASTAAVDASPAAPVISQAASAAPVTLITEPAAQAPPPPPKPATSNERVTELLGNIEKAAAGPSPDTAAVRNLLKQLRAYLAEKTLHLSETETGRLLCALSDTSVMDQIAGAIGADPYEVMTGVETALKKSPPDRLTAKKLTADLHELLANARVKIQPEAVKRFLTVLRDAKMFDELSWMADRFAARDPKLIGLVTTSYAQGLIDSGRLVAGIEMLHGAEDHKVLTAEEVSEAAGILGRGHKQIYMNHVKTASDAIALKDKFSPQLTKAVESYGRFYDPAKPSENTYHGINYIALLKRAGRDGISVEAKGDADSLARGMISALEPKAKPETENPWDLATLAEAYLALGYLGKSAEYFALYANHPKVTAFQLNGTVRQLEEVWQLKCGAEGADAILTNLKTVLAQMEKGFVTLRPEERRAIAKVGSVEFQSTFETVTQGGKLFNFGFLKRIVTCGESVAAIQEKMGQSGRTVGTGFLVKGSDFCSTLGSDKSYILTNAHVVWDPGRNQGSEDNAILPDETRIIFENDQIDGRQVVYGCRIVWQSPSCQLDATLLELDKPAANIAPLELAPATAALTVAGETSKGSKLAVLGHPNGGNLSIGVLGTLDQMQGTLIDRGPRSNSENPIFLHYMTPTEPGNSGSPVFEAETWRVVGLHHAGFIQSKGGIPKLGGKAGSNMANEGIWIESIRAAVTAELAPPPAPKPEAMPKGRKQWFK